MRELEALNREDRAFVADSIRACERLGSGAALLLVGSRAAGFAGTGSDLDLWLLGSRADLSPEERAIFDANGELFVDRGDLTAHRTFLDTEILTAELSRWNDEKMWVLATSKPVHGNGEAALRLKERFRNYPRDVARRKLRWLVGSSRALLSSIPKSGERRALAAIPVLGRIVESLCRICCVADETPFPYPKWLVRVASDTRLGSSVVPAIEDALGALESSPRLPADVAASDWPPRRALMQAFRVALEGLPRLGWRDDWIDDPWLAVSEFHSRPTP